MLNYYVIKNDIQEVSSAQEYSVTDILLACNLESQDWRRLTLFQLATSSELKWHLISRA